MSSRTGRRAPQLTCHCCCPVCVADSCSLGGARPDRARGRACSARAPTKASFAHIRMAPKKATAFFRRPQRRARRVEEAEQTRASKEHADVEGGGGDVLEAMRLSAQTVSGAFCAQDRLSTYARLAWLTNGYAEAYQSDLNGNAAFVGALAGTFTSPYMRRKLAHETEQAGSCRRRTCRSRRHSRAH